MEMMHDRKKLREKLPDLSTKPGLRLYCETQHVSPREQKFCDKHLVANEANGFSVVVLLAGLFKLATLTLGMLGKF